MPAGEASALTHDKEFTMTHEQHFDAGVPADAKGGLSRRKLIATGATLAAAGVAVGAAGTFAVSAATGGPTGSVAAPSEEVMLHLLHAESGKLAVFIGERRAEITDKDMVAKLIEAANNAIDE
jgi:hypothetical protein